MSKNRKSRNPKVNGFIKNKSYQIIFLAITTFIIYGNTLNNGYSLDDGFVIENNARVEKGIEGIPELFASYYSDTEKGFTYGYRPIVTTTFAIEYELFGNKPGLSHFFNVLLYTIACILLFLILLRIFRKYHYLFPLAITALFITHPIHTEVVASLKNRDELLGLVGALFSMLFMLKYSETKHIKFLFGGFFFYLFAYFSKPTVLPFIVLIPMILYFFTDLKLKKIMLIALGFLLIFLIAKYLPQLYLEKGSRPRYFYENNIRYEDFFARLTTGFYILLFYLKKLILPFPLLYYYGFNMIPIVGIKNPWVLLSILLHFSLFIIALYKIRQKNIFSFVILFYLVSIFPFTNVIKPIMGIVAERFLLTPSIAFCISIVLMAFHIFRQIPNKKSMGKPVLNKIILTIFIIIIPYSAITINRNLDWKDHITLFEADMDNLKNSVKANELYADRLSMKLSSGDYSKIEQNNVIKKILVHYKQILALYPEHYEVWNNMATVYSQLNMQKKSITCLTKAIELKPKNPLYFLNLGVAYRKSNDIAKAIESWYKCLQIDSTYNEARIFLSRIYLEEKDLEMAIKINKDIIRIDSMAFQPYENIGFIYLSQNDTLSAIACWEKSISINPDNENLCSILISYFNSKNDLLKADYYKGLARQ